jgi:uncharacterized protein YjbI with pentapeptide repeats
MKKILLMIGGLLTSLVLALPSVAENLSHLNQLLNTKECQNCELSHAGLVMVNLAGAKLSGANLVNANLSRANLSGADLTNANLSGASLYGANLTGANLTGAIVNTTDLRNAYLFNADLSEVNLETAYVQGAVGIPKYAADAEQFYLWGLVEDQKGNYQAALNHYNQAIDLDAKLAPAYLGRAVISSRLGDIPKAIRDAETAGELFKEQNNQNAYELSNQFVQAVKAREEIEDRDDNQGNPQFVQIVNTIGPLLLQFLLP